MVLQDAESQDASQPTSDMAPAIPCNASPEIHKDPSGDPAKFHIIHTPLGMKYEVDLHPSTPGSWLTDGSPEKTWQLVTNVILSAEDAVRRPLNQDEVDALACNLYKYSRITSTGGLIGAGVGSWMAYRALETGKKWPFSKSGPTFNPHKLGPFTGLRAKLAWWPLYGLAYTLPGYLLGLTFAGSYALTVNVVAMQNDPRLKSFQEERRRRISTGQINRPAMQTSPVVTQEGMMDKQAMAAARRIGMDTSNSKTPLDPTYSRGTSQIGRAVKEFDHQSPTAGAFSHDFSTSSSQTELLDDRQTEEEDRRNQLDADSSYRQKEHTTNNPSPQTGVRPADSFDYDDASPSAPTASAWDRLRGNALSSPGNKSPSAWSQSQAQQKQGDDFAFSSTDEERQLAKSEAQADFDARVERERRGGDFTQSSRGYSSTSDDGTTSDTTNAWERLRKK